MSSPFVPLYRQFPTGDAHNLEKQLVNFHNQTNSAVNNRTISTFESSQQNLAAGGANNLQTPIANGERWFPLAGQQRLRDGFRLVVQITDGPPAVLAVTHNIAVINQVTRLYGSFFDGADWHPLPYVDQVAANRQIALSVSPTQIVVTKGAGAVPAIVMGTVVLEFL